MYIGFNLADFKWLRLLAYGEKKKQNSYYTQRPELFLGDLEI